MKRNFDQLNEPQQALNSECEKVANEAPEKRQKKPIPTSTRPIAKVTPQFELLCGISEFTATHLKPIRGVVKQRFEDFIVHEIDLQGNVVHLTSQEVPIEKSLHNPTVDPNTLVEQGLEALKEHSLGLSDEVLVDFKSFLTATETKEATTFCFSVQLDKEVRTKMHDLIKRYFPQLISDTFVPMQNEPGRCVRVRFANAKLSRDMINKEGGKKPNNKRQRDQMKKRNRHEKPSGSNTLFDPRFGADTWPRDRPPYLRFVLYKENKDGNFAISTIARHIRVHPKMFSIAGQKDKRGITVQHVTAKKLAAEKLAPVNKLNPEIQVGNFCYVEDQLRLGDLRGNRFSIVLRDIGVEVSDRDVQDNLDALIQQGFINYFGMQRFGSSEIYPTFQTGIHIFKCEWKEAALGVLMSRMEYLKNEGLTHAIQTFLETQDGNKALVLCPKSVNSERSMLSLYAKNGPNDHFAALNSLPRIMRVMYTHSYQSLVWNHMVTARIKKYGLKPVIGDLVLPLGDSNTADTLGDEVDSIETGIGNDDGNIDGEQCNQGAAYELGTPLTKRAQVQLVTELNIHTYTIDNVVMPIPGFDVEYPTHEINRDHYVQYMSETHGITLDMMQHVQKEYVSYGAYRHVIAKAQGVECKRIEYKHQQAQQRLLDTDLDTFSRKDNEPLAIAGEAQTKEDNCAESVKRNGLVIHFSLPTSCYATMLLREFTKTNSIELGTNK